METYREKYLLLNPDEGTDSGNALSAFQYPVSSFMGAHSVNSARVNLHFKDAHGGKLSLIRVQIESGKAQEFCQDLANEIAFGKETVINLGDEAENSSFSIHVDEDSSSIFVITESAQGAFNPVVPAPITSVDALTIVEATHAGRIVLQEAVDGNKTYSIPSPSQAGVTYRFVGHGTGSAAEAQEIIFDFPDDATYFDGGLAFIESDAGAANSGIWANNSTNDRLTVSNNAFYDITMIARSTTSMYVTGYVVSDTAPAFSNQD